MKGKFIPMTEKYKRKHYPEGYFAALTKTHVRAGIGLLIMAVPCLLIGIAGICGILWFFFNGGGTASDIFGLLILLLFPGAFLAIGIFCLWAGKWRKGSTLEEEIRTSVEVSKYPESVIRDFDRQTGWPDTLVVQLKSGGTEGILTKDYICCFGAVVIKREDIKGVYLVERADTVMIRNKMKTIYSLDLSVLSKHGTCGSFIDVKRESAGRLIALLRENNPDIDTAGGKVFSEKEFDSWREMQKSMLGENEG